MRLEPADIRDLRPIISAVVAEVLEQMQADDSRMKGRLAYTEAEAAGLLGVARHTLRDARLRGEISGSLVGKKILYSRDDLLAFLRRQRT